METFTYGSASGLGCVSLGLLTQALRFVFITFSDEFQIGE